jgi:hypothetical protein
MATEGERADKSATGLLRLPGTLNLVRPDLLILANGGNELSVVRGGALHVRFGSTD